MSLLMSSPTPSTLKVIIHLRVLNQSLLSTSLSYAKGVLHEQIASVCADHPELHTLSTRCRSSGLRWRKTGMQKPSCESVVARTCSCCPGLPLASPQWPEGLAH